MQTKKGFLFTKTQKMTTMQKFSLHDDGGDDRDDKNDKN